MAAACDYCRRRLAPGFEQLHFYRPFLLVAVQKIENDEQDICSLRIVIDRLWCFCLLDKSSGSSTHCTYDDAYSILQPPNTSKTVKRHYFIDQLSVKTNKISASLYLKRSTTATCEMCDDGPCSLTPEASPSSDLTMMMTLEDHRIKSDQTTQL